jgi:hypothetical protein
MLERGQNDFVAGANEFAAVTMHYEIDRICGAAGEDDFPIFARIDKTLQFAA